MASFNGEDFAALTVLTGRYRKDVTYGFARHSGATGITKKYFPIRNNSGGCTLR
jgi:hypothetical protein